MTDPHILVTGAAGLIGNALTENFKRNHIAFTPIVHRNTKGLSVDLNKAIQLDLTELNLIDKLPKTNIIVHCAAAIPDTFDKSVEAAQMNRQMDNQIISYCKMHSARLIYCSSASVYFGKPTPWHPEQEVRPNNPYSLEKRNTEKQIQQTLDSYVILRIHAPYGANQATQTVMHTWIKQCISHEILKVHGDGSRQQRFIHANDVAEFIRYACLGSQQGIYNIAGEELITMKKLAELILKCCGRESSEYTFSEPATKTIDEIPVFDMTHTLRDFPYQPQILLEQGIKQLIDHYKK